MAQGDGSVYYSTEVLSCLLPKQWLFLRWSNRKSRQGAHTVEKGLLYKLILIFDQDWEIGGDRPGSVPSNVHHHLKILGS